MKITVVIEGILFLVFGLVGMAEGFRLVIYKDPHILYDPLGPGLYVIAISISLMAIGVLHVIVNYTKLSTAEKVPVDKKMRVRMIGTISACAIYIFLISIIGYLLATIIFFFMDLRIQGVKSWRSVVIFSLVSSAVYYLIFVQFCDMVFPRGIFFR